MPIADNQRRRELALQVTSLVQHSIAAKSRRSYASAEAKWRTFCSIVAMPQNKFPSEDEMCMFVAWAKSPADEDGGGIQGTSIALYFRVKMALHFQGAL